MTYALPEPPSRRRWPWSSRAPLGSDIATGLALFMAEAAAYAWLTFAYGIQMWAADGVTAVIDGAELTAITWTGRLLLAVLFLAVLAALARAPWTVVSQILAAGALAVLLTLSQHDYDRTHPAPAPTSSVTYSPCYSGSGTCG